MVDEQHLIELERLLPVLGAVVRRCQAQQRREVTRVQLVGLAEGLDGFLVVLDPGRDLAEPE